MLECDAAVMVGKDCSFGAVASLQGYMTTHCILDCIALWGEGGRWELGGHEVNRGECDKGCFAIQGDVNKYSFSVLELVGGWEGGKQGVHSTIGV